MCVLDNDFNSNFYIDKKWSKKKSSVLSEKSFVSRIKIVHRIYLRNSAKLPSGKV